jgi:hypothetical protein
MSLNTIELLGEEKNHIMNGHVIHAKRFSHSVLAGIVINVQLHQSKYGTAFAGIGFGRLSIKSNNDSIIGMKIIY